MVGRSMTNESNCCPWRSSVPDEHLKNNLPDILTRWTERDKSERLNTRNAQSFSVPKEHIVAQGYDLSLNRYKEIMHEEVEHLSPQEILSNLGKLELDIQKGMKELETMLR
jgi:type I restriction enzyme M protein